MADQEQLNLKQIIGDGLAKVTASRELSKKNYGNGGSVHLSVTLTCDQSVAIIDWAAKAAGSLVEKYANEQYPELQQQLQNLGITT